MMKKNYRAAIAIILVAALVSSGLRYAVTGKFFLQVMPSTVDSEVSKYIFESAAYDKGQQNSLGITQLNSAELPAGWGGITVSYAAYSKDINSRSIQGAPLGHWEAYAGQWFNYKVDIGVGKEDVPAVPITIPCMVSEMKNFNVDLSPIYQQGIPANWNEWVSRATQFWNVDVTNFFKNVAKSTGRTDFILIQVPVTVKYNSDKTSTSPVAPFGWTSKSYPILGTGQGGDLYIMGDTGLNAAWIKQRYNLPENSQLDFYGLFGDVNTDIFPFETSGYVKDAVKEVATFINSYKVISTIQPDIIDAGIKSEYFGIINVPYLNVVTNQNFAVNLSAWKIDSSTAGWQIKISDNNAFKQGWRSFTITLPLLYKVETPITFAAVQSNLPTIDWNSLYENFLTSLSTAFNIQINTQTLQNWATQVQAWANTHLENFDVAAADFGWFKSLSIPSWIPPQTIQQAVTDITSPQNLPNILYAPPTSLPQYPSPELNWLLDAAVIVIAISAIAGFFVILARRRK